VRNLASLAEKSANPEFLPLWAGQSASLPRKSDADALGVARRGSCTPSRTPSPTQRTSTDDPNSATSKRVAGVYPLLREGNRRDAGRAVGRDSNDAPAVPPLSSVGEQESIFRCNCTYPCKPVVGSPAVHTTDSSHCEYAEGPIERGRLLCAKLDRGTERTFSANPEYSREPAGPGQALRFHWTYRAPVELQCESSHSRRAWTLPVANAMQESAAP
jgi:hypothetical protein